MHPIDLPILAVFVAMLYAARHARVHRPANWWAAGLFALIVGLVVLREWLMD